MAEFAKPRPVTPLKIQQPKFYATVKDVPFWMYWPSDAPFPPEIAELCQKNKRFPERFNC
jgi:hypothetical protein